MVASDYVNMVGTPRSCDATGGGCQKVDSGAKPDRSHNKTDMFLVESWGKTAVKL